MWVVTMKQVIGVNEKGLRVGQYHQRAKLLDSDVDLIRDFCEAGMKRGEVANKFGVCRSTIDKICNYRFRVQKPVRFLAI
jgi:hypothetical protein